jgi:hypothetical protein
MSSTNESSTAVDALPPVVHRPVRVAVQLQPQHADWQELRRAAVGAEELGV